MPYNLLKIKYFFKKKGRLPKSSLPKNLMKTSVPYLAYTLQQHESTPYKVKVCLIKKMNGHKKIDSYCILETIKIYFLSLLDKVQKSL